MVKDEQKRYEVLVRVRNFGIKHQPLFPATSTAGQAFGAVAEAAAAIERQSATRLVGAKAGASDLVAARKEVQERLAAFARTARRAVGTGASVADVFRLPRVKSDLAWLTAARAFVQAGTAGEAWWVRLGLPETAVADLGRAADTLEQAIIRRQEGRSGVTAARVSLKEALARGFDAVRQLDVIVANTPQLDAAVRAVWRESRRVSAKSSAAVAGAATAAATPAAATPSPAAASPPVGEGGAPAVPNAKSPVRENEPVAGRELTGVTN